MISEFVGVVVSTSDEKRALPYMERLQKEHCTSMKRAFWHFENFDANGITLLHISTKNTKVLAKFHKLICKVDVGGKNICVAPLQIVNFQRV